SSVGAGPAGPYVTRRSLRVVLLVDREHRVRVLVADPDPEAEALRVAEEFAVRRVLAGDDLAQLGDRDGRRIEPLRDDRHGRGGCHEVREETMRLVEGDG